ncbi:MAG: hypothetical protein GKS06_09705 [Acidobacteria bacterium]|nr:hypothetical protein [Acidobacteriota bacterium]
MTPFRVHNWDVYPDRNLISSGNKQRTLEPRQMELLVCLARAEGQTVRKDDLLRDVWGDRFVVEHVVPKTVSALRAALGESASRPRIIQTVPRRGYRLGGAVTEAIARSDTGAVRSRWRPFAQLSAAATVGAILAVAIVAPMPSPEPALGPEKVNLQVKIRANAPIELDYDFEFDTTPGAAADMGTRE